MHSCLCCSQESRIADDRVHVTEETTDFRFSALTGYAAQGANGGGADQRIGVRGLSTQVGCGVRATELPNQVGGGGADTLIAVYKSGKSSRHCFRNSEGGQCR